MNEHYPEQGLLEEAMAKSHDAGASPLIDPREVEILAPKGMSIQATKQALQAAGVEYSIRRTTGEGAVSLASDGVLYEGPSALDEFLLLRNRH